MPKHSRAGRLFLFVTLVCALLCGCLPSGGPTEIERRMFNVKLQPIDFPLGWKEPNYSVEEVEGALAARTWAFVNRSSTSSMSLSAAHRIIIYPSADAAAGAYPELLAEVFPTPTWVSPAQMHYHSSVADQFRLACIPAKINGVPFSSCRSAGQYGDLVSIFVTNVSEDRWFTWKDLEHLLRVIDERMAAETQ